jgi:ADP-ribose pyrophosphatase YjhB (NUDIX family)
MTPRAIAPLRCRFAHALPLSQRAPTLLRASAMAVSTAAAAVATAACSEPAVTILTGRGDPYGGLTIEHEAQMNPDQRVFGAQLDASLAAWRESGVRGVWLRVPVERIQLVQVAVEHGFQLHHADPMYIMLTNWLPENEESPLPPSTSTQLGVGCLVVNGANKVLLVEEAVGPAKGLWKIPTGLLNAREDIGDGAERECLEETGVRATFEKVIVMRHAHMALHGKSDLFAVCLMRADETADFKLQAAEIAQARWADYGEFLQQAPYPRDTAWAQVYNRCVGEDGVVGNVPGIDMTWSANPKDGVGWYVYHAQGTCEGA